MKSTNPTLTLLGVLVVAAVVASGAPAEAAGNLINGATMSTASEAEKGVFWEDGTCEARYECCPGMFVVCEGTQECVVGDSWVECDGWRNECPPPEPCFISVECSDGSTISCSGQCFCIGDFGSFINCDGRRRSCPWGPMYP